MTSDDAKAPGERPVGMGALAQLHEFEDRVQARLDLVEPLMQKVGIPEGKLREVFQAGSDWEFVIQLSVMVEAALTEALISHLQNEKLRRHVDALSTNGRTGKVLLAVDVGLLGRTDATSIERLFDVRNAFAHSPKWISGSLGAYAESLRDAARFVRELLGTEVDGQANAMLGKSTVGLQVGFRFVLWTAAGQILASLSIADIAADSQKKLAQIREQTADVAQWGLRDLWQSFPIRRQVSITGES